MSVPGSQQTPAQVRKRYAERAEAALHDAERATTTWKSEQCMSAAQVYATLALAFKD